MLPNCFLICLVAVLWRILSTAGCNHGSLANRLHSTSVPSRLETIRLCLCINGIAIIVLDAESMCFGLRQPRRLPPGPDCPQVRRSVGAVLNLCGRSAPENIEHESLICYGSNPATGNCSEKLIPQTAPATMPDNGWP
uniref:Secreted protein n=1 Tax=Grammatophora oceanica TaxID=210454 RepID=A0A6U5PHS9_9STRA